MNFFLFVTQGELEEKLSLKLYHKMKEAYPEVEISFSVLTIQEDGKRADGNKTPSLFL